MKNMIRENTVLVAMDAVCGETGVVWNTREVAHVLRGCPTSTPLLHVDASQAPLTEKISRAHFDADMLTIGASKVGEARGIGAFIAHRTIPLAPLYEGGGQERGLRSGSEAPELAQVFAASLSDAALNRESFRASARILRAQTIKAITTDIPNVYINEGRAQAPHILNLSLPDRDTDYLVALLDEAGYAVSTRSACETDSKEGSRAVLALTANEKRAQATIRISWNERIKTSHLRGFAQALIQAVAFVDRNAER